jgi:hypothetical protein
MIKECLFNVDKPVGKILLNMPELNINKWIDYHCDMNFHTEDSYNEMISVIQNNMEENQLCLIVDDSSKQIGYKRLFIRIFDIDYLKI